MPKPLAPESRVAIVGGGIGGLTLANLLQQQGWGCITVFEQWQALKTRGGAISVMPGALGGCEPVLELIGLHDTVRGVGRASRSIESYYNGQVVAKAEFSLGTRVMREALQQILFENLRPGTVHFGASVHDFEERGDHVQVELSDGTVQVFDFVVAADGISSAICERLFPDSGKRFAGTVIYQCLAHGEFLPADFYEHHVDCGDYGFTVRAFAGSGFDGRWDSVAFTVRSDVPVSSSWDAEGTKEPVQRLLDAMRRHGGDCPEWIRRIVEKSERVMRWGIYETGPKPSWTSPGGRLVLLGDAAHAMAPFLGMGAQSAMLDARALAAELARGQPLADALSAYQAERKGPCERLMSRAKFEGACITSFGAAAAYRHSTRQLLQTVTRGFVQSPRWYRRSIGGLLLRVHELGHYMSEMFNKLQCVSPARASCEQEQ